MKLVIDTNVILDVLLERDGFYKASAKLLRACEDEKAEGFITASSVTDIFYLTRKGLGSVDKAYEAVGHILDIVKVLTVTNEDVINAYIAKAGDFEDCLLATCAKASNCDAIVTRNKKGFISFGITLLLPEEALDMM